MNLIYFTKDAYTCLLREVDGNESKYYSDNIWLDDYFKTFINYTIDVPEALELFAKADMTDYKKEPRSD